MELTHAADWTPEGRLKLGPYSGYIKKCADCDAYMWQAWHTMTTSSDIVHTPLANDEADSRTAAMAAVEQAIRDHATTPKA